MTVQEYRERLFAQLAGFDPEEVRSVVDYYTELIEDADDQHEQMQRLGSPEQLAQKIIKENGWALQDGGFTQYNNANYQGYGAGQPRWNFGRALALFFTMPIWITVYALIFALAITVICIALTLPLATVAAVVQIMWYGDIPLPYRFETVFAGIFFAGLTILLFKWFGVLLRGIGGMAGKFSYFLFMPGRARKRRRREKKRIAKGALIAGIAAMVIGAGGVFAMDAVNRSNIEAYKESLNLQTFDQTIKGDFSQISMNIDIGEVMVLKSNDGKAKLICENVEKNRLQVSGKEKLEIKYSLDRKRSYGNFRFGFANRFEQECTARFTLYLPDGVFESIYVEDLLGAVKVEGISADEVKIDCSCGSTDVKGCNIKKLEIQNNLGAVELDNCQIGDSHIDASCGSVSMDKVEHGGTAELLLSLGSLKLDDCSFDRLSVDSDCGNVKLIDCKITGGAELDLELGGAELDLKGSDYSIFADTSLGDIKINGEPAPVPNRGSVNIRIKCSSGSINVDFD